jgi:transcriptional regulator with XRE-family HTH domain
VSRPTHLPKNASFAGRALRLDAALRAVGIDLATLGARIGLKSSAARTLWRQGASPQLDRWHQAAAELGVDPDWLLTGAGDPPPRVADRLAWLLSDPDLKLSRRLDPLDQAEADAATSELDWPPQPDHAR